MKKIILTNIFLLLISNLVAQNNIKMEIDNSVDSGDLRTILRFENISMETFTFSGEIKNKNYTIQIKEFKEGVLVNTDTIFDSSQDDIFKIKSDTLKLTFLSKPTDDNLTIQMNGSFFSSKKFNNPIDSDNGKYTYKNFLGSKVSDIYSSNSPFPLFTILTPTVYEDGSKSYCRVAQSGVVPEKLGEEFDIPHYFVATIEVH